MYIPALQTGGALFTVAPVAAEFPFLRPQDVNVASDSFIQLSGILTRAPHPDAVFFDIDGTLCSEKHRRLISRTVGAMYAFQNAGVPVGIYSLRPQSSVVKFLSIFKPLSALLARFSDDNPLIIGKEDQIATAQSMVEGLGGLATKIELRSNPQNPKITVRVPVLTFFHPSTGFKKEDFPKITPADRVILVDNTDFPKTLRTIISFLDGNISDDSPILRAMRRSLEVFWHIEEGNIDAGFSSAQIDSLVRILEGIEKTQTVKDVVMQEEVVVQASNERTFTHRRLYFEKFRSKPLAELVEAAHTSSGDDLLALCFDPRIEVIRAVIQNHSFGFPHAGLVARHHTRTAGLELLVRRVNFAYDNGVRTALLRNPSANEAIIRKTLGPLSLFRTHNVTRGSEATQSAKETAVKMMQEKYRAASGEARASFIINTQGYCLEKLRDIPMHQKTIDILAKHTYISLSLINNLFKFPGISSRVIAQMLRQRIIAARQHAPVRAKLRAKLGSERR